MERKRTTMNMRLRSPLVRVGLGAAGVLGLAAMPATLSAEPAQPRDANLLAAPSLNAENATLNPDVLTPAQLARLPKAITVARTITSGRVSLEQAAYNPGEQYENAYSAAKRKKLASNPKLTMVAGLAKPGLSRRKDRVQLYLRLNPLVDRELDIAKMHPKQAANKIWREEYRWTDLQVAKANAIVEGGMGVPTNLAENEIWNPCASYSRLKTPCHIAIPRGDHWLGTAYGIVQANPGYKMRISGPDWATNPATQARWYAGPYLRDHVYATFGKGIDASFAHKLKYGTI